MKNPLGFKVFTCASNKEASMKISIHRSDERSYVDQGWLKSHFSFGFAEYRDVNRMVFGVLMVINDDIIAPSQGFGMYPHHNMEIITIVRKGVLEH